MKDHSPTFISPWYADKTDGTMIHRYTSDEFVDQFLRESTQGLLQANRHQSWLEEDKFGGDRVKLRLPIHRTFYMVSTELVCDTLGQPAFAQKKIVSAGFVVRKKVNQSFQFWRIKNGVSLGWQNPVAVLIDKDPDWRKLIKIKTLMGEKISERVYSGEQTYPLHVQVIKPEESNQRFHTLLYGYLPLSGTVAAVDVAAANDSLSSNTTNAASDQVSAAGYLAELEWPFGTWDGVSATSVCNCSGSLQEIIQDVCDVFSWSDDIEWQVDNQLPTRAFSTFIGMLMNRYQITNEQAGDNLTLINILKTIPIFSEGLNGAQLNQLRAAESGAQWSTTSINDTQIGSYPNLYNYLTENAESIQSWYSDQEAQYAKASGDVKPEVWDSLPGSIRYLYIFKHQAEQLRSALLLRAEAANKTVEVDLPLPRYTQGADDLYFICPFVRYLDECGCEKILWQQESIPFKVCSHFDPLATRPTVIQLPELSDIKKGFAKGVTFLTPKSVSDLMLKIAPTMDMKTKQPPPLDACGGFSISFNIPIITLCAMILLMIVLNLLNLIFFWLPYAILMLPRSCSPKPELKVP